MDKRWENHAGPKLISEVKAIALEGEMPDRVSSPEDRADLEALTGVGTELWLDTGDREAAGKLWAKQLKGLTTNNTLLNQVVQTGVMDDVIAHAAGRIRDAAPNITADELIIEVGFVVNARVARALVANFGAMVSVELHPALAYDIEATVLFAKRYFDLDPDNFYIKVPLTPEGVLAVRKLGLEKVPVNFTLGFSARQNHLLARVAGPAFVNIFLGRLNQVVVENEMGDGKLVGEKATLASQEDIIEARKNEGAGTRQIAASIRGAEQLLTLAGVDVHTIPVKAMDGFCEMNLKSSDIRNNLDAELKVNVDYDGINVLWNIDDGFREMVGKLAKENLDAMTGREMVKFARDNGVDDLFEDFDDNDRKNIRDTGKIPVIKDWRDRNIGLDDLMTVSALESFASDQGALDDRIRKMI